MGLTMDGSNQTKERRTIMGSRRGQQPKVIGYSRVSTEDQDLQKFKLQILDYANKANLGQVDFIEEKVSGMTSWRNRELGKVIESSRKET